MKKVLYMFIILFVYIGIWTSNIVNAETSLYEQLLNTDTISDMYTILLQNQSTATNLTIEEISLLKIHAEEVYVNNRRFYK